MSEAVVADRRVHPGTVGIGVLKDLPRNIIGLPAVLAVMSEVGWANIILIALAAAAVTILFQWLSWRSFRYGIGAGEIVIESGILSRNRRSIPFERVQDLDIERGPLARLFGLAKVKIETGGSGGDEGVLDSITLAETDRLRSAIRAGRGEPVEVAAQDSDRQAGSMLFAMSLRRVALLGLFNFSMLYLAGLFALLNTFESVIPFDIYDPGRWLGLIGEERVRGITLGAAAAVLLVALLLGVVTGLLTTISREFGFRLLGEGKRLRRERGLFTRSEIVIPKRRVQLALVRSGPIRRALGYSELRLQTLGAGGPGGGGQQSVAPLANGEELARILEEAGGFALPDRASLQAVSRRHVLRRALTLAVPLLAILFAGIGAPLVLLLLLLFPPFLAAAALGRRRHLYGMAGERLYVTAGIWRQRLWIVPVANVQALTIARSYLQRRLGLSTLAIDTAGASTLGGARIVDLPAQAAIDLCDALAAGLKAVARPEIR